MISHLSESRSSVSMLWPVAQYILVRTQAEKASLPQWNGGGGSKQREGSIHEPVSLLTHKRLTPRPLTQYPKGSFLYHLPSVSEPSTQAFGCLWNTPTTSDTVTG